jgi:hypothetical protein
MCYIVPCSVQQHCVTALNNTFPRAVLHFKLLSVSHTTQNRIIEWLMISIWLGASDMYCPYSSLNPKLQITREEWPINTATFGLRVLWILIWYKAPSLHLSFLYTVAKWNALRNEALFICLQSDNGRVNEERLIRFIKTNMLGNRLPLMNATQFEICFNAPPTMYLTKYGTTDRWIWNLFLNSMGKIT